MNLSLLQKIPKGKVTTYKELAIALAISPRMAGCLLKNNRELDNYPCYKVVCSDGSIGGYNRGPKEKIRRLKKDGIETKKDKIKNFDEVVFRF